MLLLLLLLCGCEKEKQTVNSDHESVSLVPGINKESLIGGNSDAEAVKEPENTDISEDFALVMNDEYSFFEPKLIWLHSVSDGDSDVQLNIKAELVDESGEIVEKNAIDDVSTRELILPKLIIDATDIKKSGKYIIRLSIEEKGGEKAAIEQELSVSKKRYAKEYNSYISNMKTQDYVDNILISSAYEKDGKETESEDFEELTEKLQSEYEEVYVRDDETFLNATILYRQTGDSKYKKAVEEYLSEVLEDNSEGKEIDFANRQPLYYGIIVYLKTTRPVDYKMCEGLMKIILDKAIELTERDASVELKRLYELDSDAAMSEAKLNAHILILANSVNMSIDYVRPAALYVQYVGLDIDSAFVLYELSKAEAMIK